MAHTAPSPTTNMGENSAVITEAALVLYHAVFHQEYLEFSPYIPTNNAGKNAIPSGTAPEDQAPTDTATSEIATPMAIGDGKSSSNHT